MDTAVSRRGGQGLGVLLVLVILLLVLPLPAMAAPPGWTVQQISAPGASAYGAVVGDTLAAWYEPRANYTWEFFAYDLATGVTTAAPEIAGTNGWGPQTGGDLVVWDSGEVKVFNAQTQSMQPFSEGADRTPRLAGDLMAYVGSGHTYVRDMRTQTQLVDVEVPDLVQSPELDAHHVVWMTQVAEAAAIYAVDLQTDVKTKLTDTAMPLDDVGFTIAVSGDHVAWSASDGQDDEVYVYDMSTGVTVGLTNDDDADSDVDISGNRVVWEKYDGNERYIMLYDLGTGKTSRFAVGQNPSISGDHLAWSDGEAAYLATFTPFVPFIDVPADHPYKAAIDLLASEGIVSGYDTPAGREFRPNNNVMRAQFAKMIVGSLGLAVPLNAVPPFDDLGADDPVNLYPHQYVAVAAANHITEGTSPRVFSPWNDIRRTQVVTMLVRALANLRPDALTDPPAGYTGTLGMFDDTHAANMAMAEYNHLLDGLVGFGAGWDPYQYATRGEVAQMLANFLAK